MRMDEKDLGRVPSEPGSRASTEPVPVSAASGFDPSRIESLSLGYTDPRVECTRGRWFQVFRGHSRSAAYHASNLAAHDWDVLLIDGRVFLHQTRYGGELGHWLSEDGTREDATPKEMRALYGALPDGAKYRKFDCDSDGNPEGGDRRAPGEA